MTRIDPGPRGGGAVEAASNLRHDLVTPVNHILGYCDLLIEDAESKGQVYRSRSVRAVRDLGKLALAAIDRALARAVERGRPLDVVAMGRDLAAPVAAVIEACRAIEEVAARAPDPDAFLEDLARIREAAVHLSEAAGRLAGPTIRADQAGPSSTSSASGSRTGASVRADR